MIFTLDKENKIIEKVLRIKYNSSVFHYNEIKEEKMNKLSTYQTVLLILASQTVPVICGGLITWLYLKVKGRIK